ncbi:MAG: hypothetical protein R3C56_26100 [Pirellulaceae bacterium]
MQSSRGPEYRLQNATVTVSQEQSNELTVQLDRWFDAAEYGFYSGDHHIHAAGCALHTSHGGRFSVGYVPSSAR